MKLFAILLLSCGLAQAYIPTIESLFRNGSNGEIGQNTVMATFVLKKKERASEDKESPEAEADSSLSQVPVVFTYKTLFSNDTEKSKLVQVSHQGEIASGSAIIDVQYFPRINFTAMRLGPEDQEKKLFYALLASLVNNKGDLMVKFLNDIGMPAQPNSERVDKEQLYYLGKYVKYLKLEEEVRASKENPLEPSDKEEAEKLKEIFQRPFLTPSPYVRRVKEGSEFFWVVESDRVFAKFSHDDHKLLEMSVKTDAGSIGIKCFNYILYGQDMQFPELIILKDLAGDEYLLNMKKISNFNDSPERFIERVGDYKKELEKSQNAQATVTPSFVL